MVSDMVIFIFQDFSMTFHDSNVFQDFPGFSMTVGTLSLHACYEPRTVDPTVLDLQRTSDNLLH